MKKSVWAAGITAISAAGLILLAPISTRAEEPIPEGVYVGDMSLQGLTAAEAAGKIGDYVNDRLSKTITLSVDGQEADASAADLGLSWANEAEVSQAIENQEIKGSLLNRYMKQKDLKENPVKIQLDMAVDQELVTAFVNENCGGAVVPAKDATIVKEDGNFIITPGENGTAVDIEATSKSITDALNESGSGDVKVEAVIIEEEPRITEADLSTIKDVLGTFSTDFSSSSASRATNLQVGSGKINGHVLMPGEVLSGYECMKPITAEGGYKTATAYENGRSVDSIGGGVCQISTTLYNAALFAEMEIVQRQNHSMTVSYVKPSMDSAIAGTYKDLKFKNPYDTPVYVEGYTSGRTLTFTIYGKETRPSNRTLKFESETLAQMDPGPAAEQVDHSLQPGQRVRVQSSHTGLRSRLFKCVYVDGELTERTLLHTDTYNPSKAIYRVGPAAVPAQTTPETPAENPAPAEPETSAEENAGGNENENVVLEPGYNFGPGMVTEAQTEPAADPPAPPAPENSQPPEPQPEPPVSPAEPAGPGA